jgi:hypothetical protein
MPKETKEGRRKVRAVIHDYLSKYHYLRLVKSCARNEFGHPNSAECPENAKGKILARIGETNLVQQSQNLGYVELDVFQVEHRVVVFLLCCDVRLYTSYQLRYLDVTI